MSHYKLTYFNFNGRGEIIRYLLSYMNIEFEDYRIEFDSWSEHKSSYPFGKLPVLEIDGTVYYQTLAISRYLARKAGLTGKTELDDLHINAIIDTIDDFVSHFPWWAEKAKMKEYLDKNVPIVLSGIEKELGEKKWFAGDYVENHCICSKITSYILVTEEDIIMSRPWAKDIICVKNGLIKSMTPEERKVTLADFFWDICSDSLEYNTPGFAKDYPKLLALKKRVKEVPAIAEWIKRRPQTPY